MKTRGIEKRRNLVILAVLFVYAAISLFLLWREWGQVHLKSGRIYYEQGNPLALKVLEGGVRKSPDSYPLRYYLVKVLQEKAFNEVREGRNPKDILLEGKRHLQDALLLKSDNTAYLLMAFNYEMEGKMAQALAYYNISFFLSQDQDELSRWADLRKSQLETASNYFMQGEAGFALIMAYNSLTAFRSFQGDNPASLLLLEVFLETPPDKWLVMDFEKARDILRRRFAGLAASEREAVIARLEAAGMAYLSRILTEK